MKYKAPRARAVAITQGVIWKQMLAFFFPILLGTFFQQLYNTADAMIVGQFVGKQALAAVGGTTGTLINLIVNLFVGLSAGTTVVIAQLVGAKRRAGVRRAVHTSLALAVVAGIGMTVLGLLFASPALRAMDTPADVLPHAQSYLNIILLGLAPSFLYNMGAGVLRAVGDTRRPLYFLITACLVNIGLDLLFVAGFGMGVAGAALATILSQTLAAVLTMLSLAAREDVIRFEWRRLRFSGKQLAAVLKVGLPAGLQSNMYAIANIIIQACINGFGTNASAAWTAYGKVDGLFWMVMGAFGISVSTFAGQNFGAGQLERVKKSAWVGLGLASGTAALLSVLVCSFRAPLLGIFTSDAAVLQIGEGIVWMMAPYYLTYVCIEIFAAVIRGCGESLPPMLMTAGGVCVLRLVWIAVALPQSYSLTTVLVSYPLSWVVTSAMFVVYYRFGGWRRRVGLSRENINFNMKPQGSL